MTFDVRRALAEIEAKGEIDLSVIEGKAERVPIAEAKAGQNIVQSHSVTEQAPKRMTGGAMVVQAIERGAERHGAIATASGLGATVTYQLIDRLVASRRLIQAKDGVLSVGGSE